MVLAVIKFFSAAFGLLRVLFNWKERAEIRQAGRDEVTAAVNSKTVETQDAMDSVTRPSDDAVSDSLRSSKF